MNIVLHLSPKPPWLDDIWIVTVLWKSFECSAFIQFFFWYPSFSGIGPCVGTTEVVQTPTLDSACFAALGLALIWVERQVVRMMLLLCERERLPTKCFHFWTIIHPILRRDSNPPRQSEVCYQTTALPPSHHDWVPLFNYFRYFFVMSCLEDWEHLFWKILARGLCLNCNILFSVTSKWSTFLLSNNLVWLKPLVNTQRWLWYFDLILVSIENFLIQFDCKWLRLSWGNCFQKFVSNKIKSTAVNFGE